MLGGVLATLLVAGVVSQFAFDAPDGLETVAAQTGFADQAQDHAFGNALFADYATAGVGNENVSLALAGIAGSALTLAVGAGLTMLVRRRRPRAAG